MSKTIADMPKVTQMLDAGWKVEIWKNELASYTAEATHHNPDMVVRANNKWLEGVPEEMRDLAEEDQAWDRILTDDFTPEQALTRLAYKVHGECID